METRPIISKWVVKYKGWNLAITDTKQVFDINTKTQLVEYLNNGCLSFRMPNSTERIGRRTIRKHAVREKITVQSYYPF